MGFPRDLSNRKLAYILLRDFQRKLTHGEIVRKESFLLKENVEVGEFSRHVTSRNIELFWSESFQWLITFMAQWLNFHMIISFLWLIDAMIELVLKF